MQKKHIWSTMVVICVALIAIGLYWMVRWHYTNSKETHINQLSPAEKKLAAGFKAPEFSLEEMVQAPENMKMSWKTLRGKVVVLEFWGTWCGACVFAIPHINELAKQFQNRPVQFISITCEDKSTVLPFLKTHPIDTWIGFDTDRSMTRAYNINAWPRTIIVNQEGIISTITHPSVVTAEMLEDVLAGKNISAENNPGTADFTLKAGVDQEGEMPPLFRILIRKPGCTNHSGWAAKKGKFVGQNINFEDMISSVFAASVPRIIFPSSLLNSRYDVVMNMPEGKEERMLPFVQQALEATFDLKMYKDTREMSVYVIRTSQEILIPMHKSSRNSKASYSSNPGRIFISGHPISVLCNCLEQYVPKPVVDETGLEGRYNVELKWDPKDSESLIQSVHNQLGLEVREDVKPVEVLVIEEVKSEH